MKLSSNYSSALLTLVKAGEVHVDAIEVVDKLTLDEIATIKSLLQEIPLHYHHGRLPRKSKQITQLNKYRAACSQSPYLTAHLAPLPWINTSLALQKGIYLPVVSQHRCIRQFIKLVERFISVYNCEILLENMQAFPYPYYLFESDPVVITQVLEHTKTHLLLDLAHVRIAAQVRNLTPQDYLQKLPLDLVKQIHISGVRSRNGQYYDAHQSLEAEDYRLLEWTLKRVTPQWLTLEYFREDQSQVRQQLTTLRRLL